MLKLFVLFSSLMFSNLSVARTYKCTEDDGSVTYQDKPCAVGAIQTEVKCYNAQLSNKELKEIERKLKQYRKTAKQRDKQKQQQKLKSKKQAAKEEKLRLRMREKCATAKRKIDEISAQYRIGYTIKQGVKLDRSLANYKQQRQKYCSNEQSK